MPLGKQCEHFLADTNFRELKRLMADNTILVVIVDPFRTFFLQNLNMQNICRIAIKF